VKLDAMAPLADKLLHALPTSVHILYDKSASRDLGQHNGSRCMNHSTAECLSVCWRCLWLKLWHCIFLFTRRNLK